MGGAAVKASKAAVSPDPAAYPELGNLKVGSYVDVLDHYRKPAPGGKGSKQASKWRFAQVVGVEDKGYKVHYVGWEDKWDTMVRTDSGRMAPPGTHVNPAKIDKAKRPQSEKALLHPPSAEAGGADSHEHPTAEGAGRHRARSLPDVTRPRRRDPRKQEFGNDAFDAALRGPGTDEARYSSGRGPPGGDGKGTARRSAKGTVDFFTAMKNGGMDIVEQDPDGNCLFRSVCHQVYGDASYHQHLREAVVEHMAKHKDRFRTFVAEKFDAYLEEMKCSGTWGDDLEIHAIEEVIDRNILIYVEDGNVRYGKDEVVEPLKKDFAAQPTDADASSATTPAHPIKLSYHGQAHYNSVLDERITFPLGERSSTEILDARIKESENAPGGSRRKKKKKRRERDKRGVGISSSRSRGGGGGFYFPSSPLGRRRQARER